MNKKTIILIALYCLFIQTVQSGTFSITHLRIEQLSNPLGIDIAQPRFSWQLTSDQRNVVQTAYRLLVASSPELLTQNKADIWDSEKVVSDASIWIPYQGPALKPNQRYYWKVQVHTSQGESNWSETAFWGMGLLGENRWKGRWIGIDRPFPWEVENMHSRLSARYLRKEFKIAKTIKQATLHISGLGLYECHINGERVGDLALAPAPTDYRKTVFYNSYDVSDLLHSQADNAIGITLGNGRFYTMRQYHRTYKIHNFGYPKVRMNLLIEYTDGSKETIATTPDWKLTAEGPIRSNNEYDGEEYDARKELGNWTNPGYDDSHWLQAERVSLPSGYLRGQMIPGVKVVDQLAPQSIRQTEDGRYILDMGQNMVGWLRIKVKGNAGDSIRIRFAETLQSNGELYTENLRAALATDLYILKGTELEEWAPRFVFHGFRYAEVSGYQNTATADSFIGEVVNDDMPITGNFECDNPVLNKLVQNAFWGIRGNYKGIPMDCPQRDERQPWLGDRTIGSLGESFLMENGPLYAKWMDDIRDAQRIDGCIPDVVPAYYYYYTDNITWPSTFMFISDMLYEQYGNQLPIRKHYPAMKQWIERFRQEYMNNDFIITRDRYGDWCLPPESLELIHSKDPSRITDGELIATSYYYKLLQLLVKFAQLQLEEVPASDPIKSLEQELLKQDIATYQALAEKVKKGFQQTFWDAEKQCYSNNTVTANLLPLTFDMVPKANEEKVTQNIIHNMVDYYNASIKSGVIGIQWIMRELVKRGRTDVAYVLATHTKYPGWGYMVANGATTIWELWNGNTADPAMNSGNHVMLLGDLIPFCYQHLAGIQSAAPGFKEIQMKPAFELKEVGYIRASYDTPYGKVKSHWSQAAHHYSWEVSIPANSTATVWLPNANLEAITENGKKLKQTAYLQVLRQEGNYTVCKLGSGDYIFEIEKDITCGKDRKGLLDDTFICNNPPFPESHAATIIESRRGVVAAWFGGTKEKNPDCCIWVSRLTAKGWTDPQQVADGVIDGTKFACWNPVLTETPQGELQLYYKIGENVAGWSGHVITSKNGGKTWSKSKALPEGFLGPIKNKPIWVGKRMICPSSTEGKGGWQVHFEISDDAGRTWKKVGPIGASEITETDRIKFSSKDRSTIQAIQPTILVHADGRLQALCRTRNNGSVASSWSNDQGETWSDLNFIDLPNNNSGIDGVTLKDGRHLLVYNHYRYLPGKRKERTPINVAISEDGIHWQAAIILEDSPINQYSYPSVVQGKDGKVHIVYTWRRQRIKYASLDPTQIEVKSFEEAGWQE